MIKEINVHQNYRSITDQAMYMQSTLNKTRSHLQSNETDSVIPAPKQADQSAVNVILLPNITQLKVTCEVKGKRFEHNNTN